MIADHERRQSPGLGLLARQAFFVLLLSACGGGSQPPEPLSIDSVFPVRGSELGGTQIRINGKNFSPGTQVTVGGKVCTALTLLSSSALTCVTPKNLLGSVAIQAVAPDGRQGTLSDAYTYRPSGRGIGAFGIVATVPGQGGYREPFMAKLESVLVGFDRSTAKLIWSIGGVVYKEGDIVQFPVGRHTVKLTVSDATGDFDQINYPIVVGSLPRNNAAEFFSNSVKLLPGDSISVSNNGLFPVLNPRFIGAGKPDYVDWARYLSSLAKISGVPQDSTEGSRGKLVEAAWRDFSNTTVHVCSPGREGEYINDPTLLIRGYGYECCSNASRALAFLGAFLDIPARVRTTLQHEFPEFTVNGNTFILDPDLRFRFWGEGQTPLSAWAADGAPRSLMNVTSYTAEAASGEYHNIQLGGVLPIANSPRHPEEKVRAFYYENIISDAKWEYREAFSGVDYLLYPGETLALDVNSAYVPLQWRNDDGSPTGEKYAPPVGKVMMRQLWYVSGPRRFEKDGSGRIYIPLTNLPFPVQDLIFYFGEPVDPGAYWLTAGDQVYRLGDFTSTTWTVSSEQLRKLASLDGLTAVIDRKSTVVAVDIGMQFNPKTLGDPAGPLDLTYVDDSNDCQRTLSIASGGETKGIALGMSVCDVHAPQRVNTNYELIAGSSGSRIISEYGNSYQGRWGLATAAGVRGQAQVSLPRTPGLPGLLRASTGGNFADWQIFDGSKWIPLVTLDLTSTQWVRLPATASPVSLLRVSLRQAPPWDVTYLAYLSLTEGRNIGAPVLLP